MPWPAKQRQDPLVDPCFRRLRKIGRVEVEQVVVLDVRFGRVARAQVPDSLEEAARDQPGVRQAQGGQLRQDALVVAVLQRIPDEAIRAGRLRVRGRQGNQMTLAIDAQT
jgi:hypothetical protein